jgi:hypothetical protein
VNEIIFLIEEAVEGGFTARALGESIFTEVDFGHDSATGLRRCELPFR